ncbi:MAG TPA: MCE family protein, partial [Puia sp.]
MKSNAGLKWKLGLFIISGLVLLVLGLFYIGKQKNLFDSHFRLNAVFSNVSGLKTGNNVRLGGINIGTVEGIELITDTSVMVRMSVKEKLQKFIHGNAIASIGSEGLMGDRVVFITPGAAGGETVKDNAVLGSRAPVE